MVARRLQPQLAQLWADNNQRLYALQRLAAAASPHPSPVAANKMQKLLTEIAALENQSHTIVNQIIRTELHYRQQRQRKRLHQRDASALSRQQLLQLMSQLGELTPENSQPITQLLQELSHHTAAVDRQ
jgi:hypothetical protein